MRLTRVQAWLKASGPSQEERPQEALAVVLAEEVLRQVVHLETGTEPP